jgi:hypothetical protein
MMLPENVSPRSPTEILIIAALCLYALYRQSIRDEVTDGRQRFKLALIYGIVGLSVGGFYLPPSPVSWGILAFGMLLSTMVGVARGRLTRLWIEPDGRMYRQGTPLTIALFVLLVGVKFGIGAWQYMHHAPEEHGGFGEVLLMIATMVAVQAEIVWRRAMNLRDGVSKG